MEKQQINLIDEVVKVFQDNNFSEEEITFFKSLPSIMYAYDKPIYEQMSALCSAFYQIVYYTHPNAPIDLRYYMVINNDPNLWLDGVRLNIVPYIREKKILERLVNEQKRINSEQDTRTIH